MNGSARRPANVMGVFDSGPGDVEGGRATHRPNAEVIARAKRRAYTENIPFGERLRGFQTPNSRGSNLCGEFRGRVGPEAGKCNRAFASLGGFKQLQSVDSRTLVKIARATGGNRRPKNGTREVALVGRLYAERLTPIH